MSDQEIIPRGAPLGRPLSFTPSIGEEICSRIATGESLRSICRCANMPAQSTVFLWLLRGSTGDTPELAAFSDQYARAREWQADSHADEIQDIADDGRNDFMEVHGSEGELKGYLVNGEAIQRSKLRVDTRKWIASKLKPKKYGEKLDLTTGNKPITNDPVDIAAKAASLLALAQHRKENGEEPE